SIRSTLRSSTRSSPSNPPRAFSFSNSASFPAAVPCMYRRSVSATLFLALGSFRLRNITTSRSYSGCFCRRPVFGQCQMSWSARTPDNLKGWPEELLYRRAGVTGRSIQTRGKESMKGPVGRWFVQLSLAAVGTFGLILLVSYGAVQVFGWPGSWWHV